MFENSPIHAAQVKELDVKMNINDRYNKGALFSIFPDARVISLGRDLRVVNIDLYHFNEQVGHLKSKVEFLSDVYDCELVSRMFYSNLGGRLKTLDLDFEKIYNTTKILSRLKDLPVLKSLVLRRAYIRFHDLEEIHGNLPSIQALYLKLISIENGTMPADITPATSITKFGFYGPFFWDEVNHTRFYQYVTKKYINAIDIEFEDSWLPLYHVNRRKHVYLNGILNYLRLIGTHQDKLTLYGLPDDIDPFETLDSVGSQIKTFSLWECDGDTLFSYLSQSNQSKCIEKLIIQDTMIPLIYFLKDITALTTLNITYSHEGFRTLRLTNCLKLCPGTLKTLTIKCYDLVIGSFQNKLNAVETVEIECSTLTKGLGTIISSCFPNLIILRLKGDMEKDVNIDLQSPHLKEAILSIVDYWPSSYYPYILSFKSPYYTETQYYCCFLTVRKLMQYENPYGLPILLIVTFTEKRLELNDNMIKVIS